MPKTGDSVQMREGGAKGGRRGTKLFPALALGAQTQAALAQESRAGGIKQPNGRAEVWAKRPKEG